MTPFATLEPNELLQVRSASTDVPRSTGSGSLGAGWSQLLELERDWDGHGAVPIDPHAVDRARAFASELLGAGAPYPDVVPVPDGGVQLEFHTPALSVELEFEPHAPPPSFTVSDWIDGTVVTGELAAPLDDSAARILVGALRRMRTLA